jgi:hypothetical protein
MLHILGCNLLMYIANPLSVYFQQMRHSRSDFCRVVSSANLHFIDIP